MVNGIKRRPMDRGSMAYTWGMANAPPADPITGYNWELNPGLGNGRTGVLSVMELERAQMQETVAKVRDERHMKRALAIAAVGEMATGLALLLVPSLVGQLLLGEPLTGVAIPVARVTGIALIGLGIACWPGRPVIGMLVYSAAVAMYLAFVGFAGGFGGMLLWPAVVLHVILAALLIWASRRGKEPSS